MANRTILVLVPSREEAYFILKLPGHASTKGYIPVKEDGRFALCYWERDASTLRPKFVRFGVLGGYGEQVKEPARRLISDIRPAIVVLAGICGGKADADYGLGDIIISDSLLTATYAKRNADGTAQWAISTETRSDRDGNPIEDYSVKLSRTQLANKMSDQMRHECSERFKLTEEEIRDALRQAQGIKKTANKAKLRAQLGRLCSEGPRIGFVPVFSYPENQKGVKNPLDPLTIASPTLQAVEMEAACVRDVMRELGRLDSPLLIKCISDVPGFARSERLLTSA